MSKTLWISVGVAIIGLGALIAVNQFTKSKTPLIGDFHTSQGEQHIARGAAHEAYNSNPPSSGPHYSDSGAPTPWGVYSQEVQAEAFLHNEEHGGIVITYQPNLLSTDQLKKLGALFLPPYSNKNFSPVRAIVTPRAKNTHMIELASWTYTLSLDSYDEATIIKFYNQHAGHAPEPLAGPNNTPISM